MPTSEQIVMSKFDGDAFAILQSFNILAGIYKHINYAMRRLKINMESGSVTALTSKEIQGTRVGVQHLITSNYRVEHVVALSH